MTFINILNKKSHVEDLKVNDNLLVGKSISTNELVVSGKLTVLESATVEGLIATFTEDLDDETTEEVDLYEKVSRIDELIKTNTLAHYTNAAAISTRYTKTQSDALFSTLRNDVAGIAYSDASPQKRRARPPA